MSKQVSISREGLSKCDFYDVTVTEPGQPGGDQDVNLILEYLHFMFAKGCFYESSKRDGQ